MVDNNKRYIFTHEDRQKVKREDKQKGGRNSPNKFTPETGKINSEKAHAKMTPEERSMRARHAIETRWKKMKEQNTDEM